MGSKSGGGGEVLLRSILDSSRTCDPSVLLRGRSLSGSPNDFLLVCYSTHVYVYRV